MFDRYLTLGYDEYMKTLRIALLVVFALTLAVFALACSQGADSESTSHLTTFAGEASEAETPVPEAEVIRIGQ